MNKETRAERDADDTTAELVEYLTGFVTAERLERMEAALAERTRYLTVVVEDIYQPHNASAVLRTCDCFGVQDVHIIENRNRYRVNPGVELGTAQWLTLRRYRERENNTAAALEAIRARGYRIVATTPHTDQVALEEFDLGAGPAALVFGNELDGLSPVALDHADAHLVIPMYGFVESFNISVSAAIVLHHLTHALRSSGLDYRLSADEREAVLLGWLRSSVGRADALEREFYARRAARPGMSVPGEARTTGEGP
ncbi:MAG: TrmH family RNA methyltransferase [Spirochaetota bacterium]